MSCGVEVLVPLDLWHLKVKLSLALKRSRKQNSCYLWTDSGGSSQLFKNKMKHVWTLLDGIICKIIIKKNWLKFLLIVQTQNTTTDTDNNKGLKICPIILLFGACSRYLRVWRVDVVDGHSTLNTSQRKTGGFVLLVLKYGHTAVLQNQARDINWIKRKLYTKDCYCWYGTVQYNFKSPDVWEESLFCETQRAGSPAGTL